MSPLVALDLGWFDLVAWALALHAVALPAAVGVATARFRATVPPPARWVAIAGALGAGATLVAAAAVRLASPRATATLVAAFGPALGLVATLLLAAFVASLVHRQWATALAAVAQAVALVLSAAVLAFMTTPGDWPSAPSAVGALLNPTALPLLLGRAAAVAVATGACLLYCATRGGDQQRPRALLAGALLALAGTVAGVAAGWLWLRATGPEPVAELLGESSLATGAARLATATAPTFAALTLAVAFVSLSRFDRLRRAGAALLVLLAVAGVGGAELARVALSGPWILGTPPQGWLLSNGLTGEEAEAARRAGLARALPTIGEAGAKPSAERGERIRAATCAPCHSTRGLRARLEGWPRAAIAAAVARLDRLSPASPPFPGDAADARDLALALALLDGREEGAASAPPDPIRAREGRRLFGESCDRCHREVRLERTVAGWNEALARRVVERLPRMNAAMQDVTPRPADREALAAHLVTLGGRGR